MNIYLYLIGAILTFSIIVKFASTFDDDKKESVIAGFGSLAIYLVLALKKYTVGIDIRGYYSEYLKSANKEWSDVDYVYFEKGYIQLMKLFSKNEVEFQYFMMFIYAVLCISLYLFIKKYSKNATLSLLIFICYQFFVFSVSGVRQTIAMAICMFSYSIFDRNKKFRIIIPILMTIGAIYFHKSAIVFLAVYYLSLFRKNEVNIAYYILMFLASFVIRPFFLRFVESQFDTDKTDSVVTLGGAFIFLVGMAIFVWAVPKYFTGNNLDSISIINFNGSRILLVAVISYILFSGSALLRATMYLNLFLIPCVPNTIKMLDDKSLRLVLEFLLGGFLIYLFYHDTLVPNQLELCPYLFYWQ